VEKKVYYLQCRKVQWLYRPNSGNIYTEHHNI